MVVVDGEGLGFGIKEDIMLPQTRPRGSSHAKAFGQQRRGGGTGANTSTSSSASSASSSASAAAAGSGTSTSHLPLLLGSANQRRRGEVAMAMMSLRERMIDAEHEARWGDALMCYEQALQNFTSEGVSATASMMVMGGGGGGGEEEGGLEAGENGGEGGGEGGGAPLGAAWGLDESALHAGLLRCLKHLGHLETTVSHAVGVLGRCPHLAPIVIPPAVEASWQLGQWDTLERLLLLTAEGSHLYAMPSSSSNSSNFNSSSFPTTTSSSSSSSIALSKQPLVDSAAANGGGGGGGVLGLSALSISPASHIPLIPTDYTVALGSAMLHLHKAVKAMGERDGGGGMMRGGSSSSSGSKSVLSQLTHLTSQSSSSSHGGFTSPTAQSLVSGLLGGTLYSSCAWVDITSASAVGLGVGGKGGGG